jgi:hypothetical protein
VDDRSGARNLQLIVEDSETNAGLDAVALKGLGLATEQK